MGWVLYAAGDCCEYFFASRGRGTGFAGPQAPSCETQLFCVPSKPAGAGSAPRHTAPWGGRVFGYAHDHGGHHLAVGMTNSAPLPMLSGQRCMIDFCFV